MKEVVKEVPVGAEDKKVIDAVSAALEKCEYLVLWHWSDGVQENGDQTKSVVYHVDVSEGIDLPAAIAGMLIRDHELYHHVGAAYRDMRKLQEKFSQENKDAH